jgi:hypothetical protein
MAFTFALTLSGVGFCLGLLGHDALAAILFTTTIGAITTAFIVDKKPRDKR